MKLMGKSVVATAICLVAFGGSAWLHQAHAQRSISCTTVTHHDTAQFEAGVAAQLATGKRVEGFNAAIGRAGQWQYFALLCG